MKLIKFTLIGILLMVAIGSYATDYYVSVNGAGNKDGSSWENGDDNTGTPGPDSVGTEQIIDNSIIMDDLNDSVKSKIQKTYDISDESLSMDFNIQP